MNRKNFIIKSILGTAAVAGSTNILKASRVKVKQSDYDKLIDQVGFNHIPLKNEVKMNKVIHRAESRGHANHGWLDTHHSFSFANYYNPERMNFGVLRVLNDDRVKEGHGFQTHPHDNMEIISIPLSGDLEHKDSMGNVSVIKEGDIQVMSAGTGVFHSEFNKNSDKEVRFLQIWLFPKQKNVEPRYDQISLSSLLKKNELSQVLSPYKDDQGVWIHQNAWFHIGSYDRDESLNYKMHNPENGSYVFVLEGNIKVEGEDLKKRDGIGVWNQSEINIVASKDSKFLIMEVPMKL